MSLSERLRARKPVEGRPYKSDATRPINPDGPEAADLIDELCAALADARCYIANCWIDPVAADEERALVAKIDSILTRAGRG